MPSTIEVTYNNPNELPANFREVEEAEFVLNAMRRIYNPQRIDYRQVRLPGEEDKGQRGLNLYWYHNGRGDAILLDYFTKSCRYFLFAECEHSMERTNIGRCLNRYDCKKCGYSETVDSGD